jgi:DNA polymerase III epsilon subunit-like protein
MLVTVLDTETTGLDPKVHEIIQFAAVRFSLKDDSSICILDKLDIKIKPKNLAAASPQALKVNGFTPEAWEDSLEIEHHLPAIESFITNSSFLLGQNLIFDLRFISLAFKEKKITFPHYADTKHMASKLVSKGLLKSAAMDKLCEHYQIKFQGRAHTALVDCQRTLNVWLRLIKETDVDFFSYEAPFDPYNK